MLKVICATLSVRGSTSNIFKISIYKVYDLGEEPQGQIWQKPKYLEFMISYKAAIHCKSLEPIIYNFEVCLMKLRRADVFSQNLFHNCVSVLFLELLNRWKFNFDISYTGGTAQMLLK